MIQTDKRQMKVILHICVSAVFINVAPSCD